MTGTPHRRTSDPDGSADSTEPETTPSSRESPPPVGFLDPDDCFTRRYVERPFFRDRLVRIDQYDLPATDLADFAGVVVSSQADQDFLYRHRERIRGYLDDGGVVAFSGHLSWQWLPGAGTFVPKTIESHDDYVVVEACPHPVFAGVEMEDLTYHRGVAGFFARGHNPPPETATVVLRLRGGQPIVWIDGETTGGTVFVHSGNDLVGFDRRETTATRVPGQLVAWMREVSEVVASGRDRTGSTASEVGGR